MSPLAGVLLLKGWMPYMRHQKINRAIAHRAALVSVHLAEGLANHHYVVTAYPEVLAGTSPAQVQFIPRGELAKHCVEVDWDDLDARVLEMLSAPILTL